MPTPYTGVATATQTPSGPPIPAGAPIVNIPNDGESENVASVTQMVKVLADWLAWIYSPRARLSQWGEGILSFMTAALHRRFRIDHFGFPMGRMVFWSEDWSRGIGTSGTSGPVDIAGTALVTTDPFFVTRFSSVGQALINAGAAANFAAAQPYLDAAGVGIQSLASNMTILSGGSPWRVRTGEAGPGASIVLFNGPDNGTVQSRHRYVGLAAGDTATDYAALYRVAPCNYDNDLHISFEFEAQLEATGMGGVLHTWIGLCEENAIPVLGAAGDYVVFEKGSTGNWFIQRRSGGGAPPVGIDTGVAGTTAWTRFRIELHGSAVAESGGRALRCYINGTQVGGDITTDIPVAAAKAAPHFSVYNGSGGASGLTFPLRLGPVRMAHNLYGFDAI